MAGHESSPGATAAAPAPLAQRSGLVHALRARLAARRLEILIFMVIPLLVFAGSIGLWLSLAGSGLTLSNETILSMAQEALERGDYEKARELAQELLDAGSLPYEQHGGPMLIQGAATLREAEEDSTHAGTNAFLAAARYLENARDRGFPVDREAEGLFLLGKSLFLSGLDEACRAPLREAIRTGSPQKTEIHRLLSYACLSDADPKFEEALEHNGIHLSDGSLSSTERQRGQLHRCHILLHLGRLDDCRKVLGELAPETSTQGEVALMQGRLLLQQARALRQDAELVKSGESERSAAAMFQEALRVFRETHGRERLNEQVARTALYLMGVATMELGESYYNEALGHLQRARKAYSDSPEGLAACLLEADLLRQVERPHDAVAIYRMALSAAGAPQQYRNPWVSLNEFRSRVLDAHQSYTESRQFDDAVKLMAGLQTLFPHLQTLELMAETARRWAESLAQDAADLQDSLAQPILVRAKRNYRYAATTFLKLAKLRFATRNYADDLWNSAENFLRGCDFRNARRLLHEYLEHEVQHRRGEALLALGKAELALGNVEQSILAFQECIEFHPRDPATYQARLWCSKAYVETDDYDQAQAQLEQNLKGDALTPASAEWRDSLFALGHLHYSNGRFQEAIEKLDEALARYPNAPQATPSAYVLAEAYRQTASEMRQKLGQQVVESVQLETRHKARDLLDQALLRFTYVQQSLLEREPHEGLSQLDEAILRNCFFARGSVLFDLDRYDEAIEIYQSASARYQNEPVVLEAYVQMAFCFQRQNKPVEALGALEQAKVILNKFPADADFAATTNYPRQEWVGRLDRLSMR